MTFEEMQNFLSKIQSEKTQTKIMNALLSCYQEVKQHEKMIIEIQQKLNEIIKGWNEQVADNLVEYTDAAAQEVNE